MKLDLIELDLTADLVAPLAGAWIETYLLPLSI